ncbi:hypothetical protein ACJJTC_005266 [Scirpophaga incertulas]
MKKMERPRTENAKMLLIIIQYFRLGAPGFLCLGDELIPGNAGVKDVVFALRWVRDNVSAFNGNPHRVVVAGQGLGAAVVEILTLSPAAKDLMHGAILQSGSIQCPWSFNYDAMERAKSLIKIIENDYSSNVSISTIDIKYLARYSHKLPFPYYPFGLCVENSLKQGRLIEHSPNQLLYDRASLKIPIIAGYNSNEAYVFVSNLQQNNVFRKVRNLSKLLPQELQFISDVEKRDVLNQIHDLYFKGNHSTVALLSYYSDAYFVNHIYRSVRLQAQSHRTIYFYQFSRTSKLGVSPVRGVNKTGAAHSDELGFLFPPRGMDMDAHDGNIHKQLVRLWTNFVKYLDPTPNNEVDVRWEPFDETDPRVLDIDTEIEMKRFPHTRTCEIWDDIFQRFYYGRNVP